MKKLGVLFTGILVLLFVKMNFSSAEESSDMERLVSIAGEGLQSWSVMVKDEGNLAGFEGTFSVDGIDVRGKVIALPNERSQFIYELSGKVWNDDVALIVGEFMREQNFSEHAEIYSCLRGVIGDTIDKDLLLVADQILHDFEARALSTLDEEGFVAVSAESEFFLENRLSNQMNLQLALRFDEEENRIMYAIGTPIIMNEY